MVIVLPAMSAGVVFPARAVSVSVAPHRPTAERQPVRILDVRHDQPTVGGRGNPRLT
jgi:hypothetical protein